MIVAKKRTAVYKKIKNKILAMIKNKVKVAVEEVSVEKNYKNKTLNK